MSASPAFVGGVRVHEHGLLVGHHFLEDRRNTLALGKPLPPDLRQQPRGVGLVEQDRARRPAIRKGQPVEVIEQAGRGAGGETDDGQDTQVLVAKPRLQPAGQRLVREQHVQIDRSFGNTDAVALGGNG
jgi:hypothetical protein